MEKNEKVKFIVRVILWSLFSCFLPVCYIGWRYDLFNVAKRFSITGLGIIIVVIIFVFLITLIKYIRAYFSEWSMTKQIIDGVIKVILPLGVFLGLLVAVRNSIDTFIQALGIVILCEVVAIPINPFPEIIYNKTKGKYESLIDYAVNKFKEKGEK